MDKPNYVCCIVRRGIATSASTHATKKEAVEEAKVCGNACFNLDYDDIAVFKIDTDGTCLEQVFEYIKK